MACFPSQIRDRRVWSSARLRAVCRIQAVGLEGTPVKGQASMAFPSASWTTSSARCRCCGPKRRVRMATSRPASRRKRLSTTVATVADAASGERSDWGKFFNRAHLDDAFVVEARATLGDLDGLGERVRRDDDVASDRLLGLRIGPVGHRRTPRRADDLAGVLQAVAADVLALGLHGLQPGHPLAEYLLHLLGRGIGAGQGTAEQEQEL